MDRLGKPFELLVTHVTKHYGLVKIFGQTDLKAGHHSIIAGWVKLYQRIVNVSPTGAYIFLNTSLPRRLLWKFS